MSDEIDTTLTKGTSRVETPYASLPVGVSPGQLARIVADRDRLAAEVARLTGERDRLLAALDRIASDRVVYYSDVDVADAHWRQRTAREARAALARPKEQP